MLSVLKLGLMGYRICGIYMYLIMRSSVPAGNDHVVASVWVVVEHGLEMVSCIHHKACCVEHLRRSMF